MNTILGCHERTMAMGPPNRFWKLKSNMAAQACMIHREKCHIWPDIIRSSPSGPEWFRLLAEKTGKDIFILNYPDREFYQTVIEPLNARVLHIKLVRDGRANLYSMVHHHNVSTRLSVLKNVIELPDNPADYCFLRHEDLMDNPADTLDKIGSYIGITYDAKSAMKFWEWEHHLTAGNVAMLDMICRLQGLEGYEHSRRNEYNQFIEESRNGMPIVFRDNSWIEGLSSQDRLIFDCLLGEYNASNGYDRDNFDEGAVKYFWETYDSKLAKLLE